MYRQWEERGLMGAKLVIFAPGLPGVNPSMLDLSGQTFHNNIKHRKAANPQVLEAETSKCLVVVLDK